MKLYLTLIVFIFSCNAAKPVPLRTVINVANDSTNIVTTHYNDSSITVVTLNKEGERIDSMK